jgi:nucleotide-binding universal stress UspA family protein
MQSILFPTDFSAVSDHALTYALKLAHKLGARIQLLHVGAAVAEPAHGLSGSHETASSWQPMVESRFAELGIEVEVAYQERNGQPVEQIVAEAEALKASMIVMGTRGKNRQSLAALGSVTVGVMQATQVPVLAIPASARYQEIRHIAYATDFSQENFDVIEQLLTLSRVLDAKIAVVHVRGENEYWDRIQRTFFERLYHLEQTSGGRVSFYILHHNDALTGIQKFVEDNHIDLLAMLTHRPKLLGRIYDASVTAQTALHTQVPLLIFHE